LALESIKEVKNAREEFSNQNSKLGSAVMSPKIKLGDASFATRGGHDISNTLKGTFDNHIKEHKKKKK